MSRRSVLNLAAALLALAVAHPALAANKTVDASKMFPFLGAYLKLPPAERSRFAPAYYLRQGPQPLTAPVWLLDEGKRVPIPIRADGRIESLPSPAALAHDKVEFGLDAATKLGVTMGIEPTVAPSADMDARDLAAAVAVAQANAGARKAPGLMAMVMPKLQSVSFVGATSGEVEFADGRRAPLPLVKGLPNYNPALQPNAKRIRFAKPPLKLDID